MGALENPRHEQFCQQLRRLLTDGRTIKEARDEAYRLTSAKPEQAYLTDNARKLANQPHVKARMAELNEEAAKLLVFDAAWAMRKLAEDHAAIGSFNLNDYLRRDGDGMPYFDLTDVPADKMALLTELALETVSEAGASKDDPPDLVRKIKLKGPSKYPERTAIMGLMARIGGWEAPRKVAPTTPDGKKAAHMSLESLVLAAAGIVSAAKDGSEEQAA